MLHAESFMCSSFSALPYLFHLFSPETKLVLNLCELTFGQNSSPFHLLNKDRELCDFSQVRKSNITLFTFQCWSWRLGGVTVLEIWLLKTHWHLCAHYGNQISPFSALKRVGSSIKMVEIGNTRENQNFPLRELGFPSLHQRIWVALGCWFYSNTNLH